MTHPCRHFLGLYPDDRPSCAKGWDVRKWAVKCNGGSEFGIGLRLPCTKKMVNSEAPLFDCPSLDRKTQTEVDAQRKKMHERMDRIVKGMGEINKMRAKMVKHNLTTAKATCPWCDEKNALKLSCNIQGNKHVHCRCSACGEGFIE